MAERKESGELEPRRFREPFEEIERWFDDLLGRRFPSLSSRWPRLRFPEVEEVSPSFDIYEEGDDIVVKGELPGMKREDLSIDFTEDTITISGEKRKEEKVEQKNYYRYERSCGSFSRRFRFPVGVETDRANAKLKDGILEVRVPKTEEAKKKAKKIDIE